MWRLEWWLAATVGLVLTVCAVVGARASHGTWESETVWIDPVVETRRVWVPGRWEDHSVWVSGRWETRTEIVEERVWQSRMVWVESGHWEDRLQWVESGYWKEVWDDETFEVDFVWVDTSHWELKKVFVGTAHWEDHGGWVTVHHERVVTVWVPGRWTTERRWIAGYYKNERVVVTPGRYETRRRWVALPHPTPTPAARPDPTPSPIPTVTPGRNCRIPSGIYKVTDHYAGTTVEETETGIRYGTATDNRPNDLYAVNLGSYRKGAGSPYDGAAFNGRHRDVNGELLAGTFYQNYRKRDGCYLATSIVFFQDDRVQFTTGTRPAPTPTPVADAESTPTATVVDPVIGDPVIADPESGSDGTGGPRVDPTPTIEPESSPTPTQRPGPTATPTSEGRPRPPGQPTTPAGTPAPVYDPPAGTIRVAAVLAGSAADIDAAGFRAIEVLRGAPIDLWVRPDVEPPASDPRATVQLQQWTLIAGANDRPGGTQPGDTGGPNRRLRFQWNDVTPIVNGRLEPYEVHLRARIRVIYSDGIVRSYDLDDSIAVTVRFQGAATWVNGR